MVGARAAPARVFLLARMFLICSIRLQRRPRCAGTMDGRAHTSRPRRTGCTAPCRAARHACRGPHRCPVLVQPVRAQCNPFGDASGGRIRPGVPDRTHRRQPALFGLRLEGRRRPTELAVARSSIASRLSMRGCCTFPVERSGRREKMRPESRQRFQWLSVPIPMPARRPSSRDRMPAIRRREKNNGVTETRHSRYAANRRSPLTAARSLAIKIKLRLAGVIETRYCGGGRVLHNI